MGGSSCAVMNCLQYSAKVKKDGSNISFHRFPKDLDRQRTWVHKCKRADKWNPQSSYICSLHFSSDDFVRDLKSELLGYSPRSRKLKENAVPTLNLPLNSLHKSEISTSAINRKNRKDAKLAKQIHDELITSCLSTSISPDKSVSHQDISSSTEDYEKLYNDLLKEHNILKTENQKQEAEFLSWKQRATDYIRINENLRSNMSILQKQLTTTNALLKKTEKEMSKNEKMHSLNKTKTIESEVQKLVSTIFTPNQFKLIIKKKKRVHWSRNEIAKAFILRYYSKRAYMFLKNELHYPLPGISSLQRWAKTTEMRNEIINDVLEIMKLNGDNIKNLEKLTVIKRLNVLLNSTSNKKENSISETQ